MLTLVYPSATDTAIFVHSHVSIYKVTQKAAVCSCSALLNKREKLSFFIGISTVTNVRTHKTSTQAA